MILPRFFDFQRPKLSPWAKFKILCQLFVATSMLNKCANFIETLPVVKKFNSISRAGLKFRRGRTSLYRNPFQANNCGGIFDQLSRWIFLCGFHRRCLYTFLYHGAKKSKMTKSPNQGVLPYPYPALWHDCVAKIVSLTKMTSWSLHQRLTLKRIDWWKLCGKSVCKICQKCHQSCSVALVFCMKLYRKLAVLRFQNWSQGQMAGKRSCKLGTIAHLCLVSRTVLGNFDILSPSNFFMSFLRKIARFWEHDLLRAISWKRNKNSKIPSTL